MMSILAAAALAAVQPAQSSPPLPPTPCPDIDTPDAYVCKAVSAQGLGDLPRAAEAFEKAAEASPADDPATARMWAAAGNMWIAADEPGKAALALDRALAGTGLRADQRGQALLDRARAAEAQNDLKTARAKVEEAAQSLGEDKFLHYFSAALAIREGDAAAAKAAINKALSLAPSDPLVLFEAGHVAHFAGDPVGARAYWTRASAADPDGATGKAAKEAIALLDKPAEVQKPEQATK